MSAERVYLYFGEDDYLVSDAARRLRDELLPDAESRQGLEVFNAQAGVIDEAVQAVYRCLEALQTDEMFVSRKVVWLRDANFVTGGAATRIAESERTKTAVQKLTQVIKERSFSPSNILIITAPKILKTSVLYKACAEAGKVEGFDLGKKPYEKERAIRQLLPDFLAKVGLTMSGATQNAFLGKVGFDVRTIMSELEKLRCYCGKNAAVTLADVGEITSVAGESEMWNVIEAVGDRAPQKLLVVLNSLSGQKNLGIPIATMLITRFQEMLVLAEALQKKWVSAHGMWQAMDVATQEAMRALNLLDMPEWKLKKLLQQVKNFTLAELNWARYHLMQMREQLVSTGGDEQQLMVTHLLRIVTKG